MNTLPLELIGEIAHYSVGQKNAIAQTCRAFHNAPTHTISCPHGSSSPYTGNVFDLADFINFMRKKGPYLRSLRLCSEVTIDQILSIIPMCSKLEELDLSGHRNLTNEGLEQILKICGKHLTSINLLDCKQISYVYLNHLAAYCPNIKKLYITDSYPDDVQNMLRNFPKLEELYKFSYFCNESHHSFNSQEEL